MVTYEVNATVAPELIDSYERYMRDEHIPDVFATNAFSRAIFERLEPGRYRIRYEAASQADLDQYLRDHTARLRADFVAHFPQGVELSRQVWTNLQRWP